MFSLDSPRVPFTVHLPRELVAELEALAADIGQSVDDIVTEACANSADSLVWEHEYQKWSRAHPRAQEKECEGNGDAAASASGQRETAE